MLIYLSKMDHTGFGDEPLTYEIFGEIKMPNLSL